MSKLGEIAYQAYGIRTIGTDADETWRLGWDAAADAVAEECAKVAEADDSFMMLQDWGLQNAVTQKGENIAAAIRALKATPSDAGLKSPEGDERPTEHSSASLTPKSETPMSDHSELIHWLRTFPFNGQMTTDQIGEAAGKCLEASEAIHSLRASLANEKEAREKADALATFFETEMTRILQEGAKR